MIYCGGKVQLKVVWNKVIKREWENLVVTIFLRLFHLDFKDVTAHKRENVSGLLEPRDFFYDLSLCLTKERIFGETQGLCSLKILHAMRNATLLEMVVIDYS